MDGIQPTRIQRIRNNFFDLQRRITENRIVGECCFCYDKKNKINQNLEVWFNKAWKIFLEDESFIDFVSFNIFAGKMLTKWKCVAISSNICISFASICFLTI